MDKKQRLAVDLPEEEHHAFKLKCCVQGKTIMTILRELIVNWIEKE